MGKNKIIIKQFPKLLHKLRLVSLPLGNDSIALGRLMEKMPHT